MEAKPPWVKLPPEITALILQKLDAVEILTTAVKVCTTWRRVCEDPSTWRHIKMKSSVGLSSSQLVEICRRAVDLSRGQLIDITIICFGDNDLLQYISMRSGQLRQLSLVNCYEMTSEGVTEAIKNLPLLEDLCLQHIPINLEDIEIIGRCCPLLKLFKLTNSNSPHGDRDIEALAIAKSMPRIRHLILNHSGMTNVGVKAILEGCPNLETFDLRFNFYVHFGGDFLKMCSERFKDVKFILDSADDEYRRHCMIYYRDEYDDDYFSD
ncbi:hypothetical protein ACP275_08G131000 [Erythranthe tilingii]